MPGDSPPLPDAAAQWQLISEIVDGALDLGGEERAAYIDAKCGSDDVLRKEVEQFLSACDLVSRSPTFLRGRPHLFLNDLQTDVEAREASAYAKLKERVQAALAGKFDVGDVLGSGGAATVFRAVDCFTKGTVALKVLHPELSHSLGSDRFLREVRIVASLRHPNIIPLLSAGIADGLPYYVMPCIEGQTLRARLQREPQLPTALVLSIARDVAAALDAAHAQGILHRDIKPQNILLDGERALVADFGIARAIESAGGDTLTESGTVIGTPGYMSPEQVSGDGPVDLRSDVYSLACVVYEMLAGEPPFTGAQSRALLAKQLWAPVPDVRVLRTSLPPAVTAALQRALSKHAVDRFATAGDFASALATAIASRILDERRTLVSKRTALVAAVLVVSGSGGWAAYSRAVAAEAAAVASADSSTVVVFPIDAPPGTELVNRDAPHAIVSRWSNVSAFGLQALHEELSGGNSHGLSTRKARTIALKFQSARYIRTTLQQDGQRLRVQAELFDVHNRAVPLWQDVRDSPASGDSVQAALTAVLDGLLLRTRDTVAIREGVTRTRSLPGRQSFLRGMTEMTAWNLAAAESAFASSYRADAGYARAALWLALTRIWNSKDSAAWAYAAEAAAAKREQLPSDEGAMTTAVVALARGDRPSACASWRTFADSNQYDFNAWYGAAQCMASDDIVVPDASSMTGWRFRTGSHSALLRFRRAFVLRPTVLGSLRDDQFRRLRRLLWTSALDNRTGRRVGEVSRTFAASPSLADDTLAFYPVRRSRFGAANSAELRRYPSTTGAAVARQRALLADIAKEWASSNPRSGPALEAVALSLCLLGDRAAVDTLHRARLLSRTADERLNTMATEVWVRLHFALPSDVVGLRSAVALADSVLRQPTAATSNPLALASVAAILGRIQLADSIEQRAVVDPAGWESPALAILARRLALYAAAAGPVDSLRALERRAQAMITTLQTSRRSEPMDRVFVRPVSLSWPEYTFATMSTLPDSSYYLLTAVNAFMRGDTVRAKRILAEIARVRAMSGTEVSLDALLTEASLLRRMGESRAAYNWLSPGLAKLKTSVPLMDAIRAAAMVRAMVLEADLAHEVGDDVAASEWAAAVSQLWHDEDAFLHPTRTRLQKYQMARR